MLHNSFSNQPHKQKHENCALKKKKHLIKHQDVLYSWKGFCVWTIPISVDIVKLQGRCRPSWVLGSPVFLTHSTAASPWTPAGQPHPSGGGVSPGIDHQLTHSLKHIKSSRSVMSVLTHVIKQQSWISNSHLTEWLFLEKTPVCGINDRFVTFLFYYMLI